MKAKKIKLKELIINVAVIVFLFVLGIVLGIVLGKVIYNQEVPVGENIFNLCAIMCIFFVVIMITMVLHEAGHLICGLLSGYEFVSFRVGKFMIMSENGKFVMKKFNLAGTGGQCLMMPNEDDYEKTPYILYNLGGVLMNALIGIVSLIIYIIFDANKYIDVTLICMMTTNILVFIMNGIPMKISGIANDGYNIISMKKDKLNRYCFFIQLKVNGLMHKGVRAREMPTEWFKIDTDIDYSNPLATSIKCIEANYYHDKLEFDKAKECYEFLLNYSPKIVKLYENEIKCELLFYEIIGDRDEEKIKELYTKELKSYIKASKSHITKARLMYAYSLIIEKDTKKADKMLKEIKKCEKTYPNKAEIENELEIVQFINENYIGVL